MCQYRSFNAIRPMSGMGQNRTEAFEIDLPNTGPPGPIGHHTGPLKPISTLPGSLPGALNAKNPVTKPGLNLFRPLEKTGAGDGFRTHDPNLGKSYRF